MRYVPRHRAVPAGASANALDGSEEARRKRLARNISWNYASGFISVFGLVLLYPFAVKIAGAESYGLWVLIFGTVQLLSTADFGLGTGVVRQLGALIRDDAPYEERERFVTVAMTLFTAMAAGMTLVYCIAFPLYLRTVPVRDAVRDTEFFAVAAGGFALLITVVARGANSVLWAEDRQDIERKCSVVGMAVRVIGYFAAALTGAGFLGVVIAEVLSLCVIPIGCGFATYTRYPHPDFARSGFRTYVKPLVGLSSVLFVGSLAMLIAFQLPTYIVGSSLGLAATAAFGAVMRVYQSSRLLISWLVNPFIQQIASAPREELPARSRNCFTLGASMGLLLAVGIATMSSDIIGAWLGSPFLFASAALAFVGLGVLADGLSQPAALVVNLRGNPWTASRLNVWILALSVCAMIPARTTGSLTWVMLAAVSAPLAMTPFFVAAAFRVLGQDPFQGRRRQQLVFLSGFACLAALLLTIDHFFDAWVAIGVAAIVVGAPAAGAAFHFVRNRRSGSAAATPETPPQAETTIV